MKWFVGKSTCRPHNFMQNRTRTTKCTEMEDARAERAKLFFAVKYANLWHSNENQISLPKNRECFYSYYKLSRRKEPKSRKDVFPFDYSQKDQRVVNRGESRCFTSISSKWMLNQNKPMANYQNEHSTLNKGLQLDKDFYFIDNNLFETFTFLTPHHYQCFQKIIACA